MTYAGADQEHAAGSNSVRQMAREPDEPNALAGIAGDTDFDFSNDDPDLWSWLDTSSQDLSAILDESLGNLGTFAMGDTSSPSLPDPALPANVHTALSMIQDYKAYRSMGDISTLDSSPQQWFSEPVDLQRYDEMIVNVFINLAVKNLGPTLPCLEGFAVHADTRLELYMAVAAVGGTFCRASGSYNVAAAMWHDARR